VRVKHLELSDKKVIRSMRELYSHGRDAVGRQLTQARAHGQVDVSAMAEIASAMLDLILRSDVPVTTMLALRGRDDYALMHAMNVSMVASAQASALGLDEAVVRSISVAALTHDIGRAAVPEAILHKSGALSATELRALGSHAAEGAKILLRTQSVDGLEAIVAAEHHLPYTSGTHLASQLVAIADVFDSVRSLRSYTDRDSLRGALRFMLKKLRHRLNPYLLLRFCALCGMYRPGDAVELTSGERGVVVAVHAELGARPTVEVTDTAGGRAPVGTIGDLSLSHMSHIAVRKDATLAFNELTVEELDALG
jgi:putative nucleotidyltransferase with HDIG domain